MEDKAFYNLSELNIERDKTNKSFDCPEIRQSALVNREFYIIDWVDGIKTKFSRSDSDGRALVLVKFRIDDPDSEARKFFTNSRRIKYTLTQVSERGAFPLHVTLRGYGNNFYIE